MERKMTGENRRVGWEGWVGDKMDKIDGKK
jgi:hypothetical protein